MADKETVIVDNGSDNRSPNGAWIGVVIVLVILVILFLVFNGFGLFGGGQNNDSLDVNVQTPQTTQP